MAIPLYRSANTRCAMTARKQQAVAVCLLFGCIVAGLGTPAAAQETMGGNERIVTLASGNTYVVYGDILVPVGPDGPDGIMGAHVGWMWPAATLYYSFHSSVTDSQRASFREWAPYWQSGSGMRIVESASVPNWVLVQTDDSDGCGWSRLGMQGGVQDLVIKCWDDPSTVLHELGHAIGLIHEQQRSDRNTYVTVQDEGVAQHCGSLTWNTNYGIYGLSTAHTAYDYASIMHYKSFPSGFYTCNEQQVGARLTVLQPQPPGLPAGSENVCTTVAQCQALLGWASYPSPRDGYTMALRYGYRIAVSVGGNGTGSISVSGQRENCGSGCYLVTPQATFQVNATPAADSVVGFSGPCSGQTCQVSPTDNGEVQVRFIKKSTLAALAVILPLAMEGLEIIFADGYEKPPGD